MAHQFRQVFVPCLLAVGGVTLLFVVSGLVAWRTGIPLRSMHRDITAWLEAPFYVGFISTLGQLGWAAGAAVALTGSVALRRAEPGLAHTPGATHVGYLRFLGFLTLILCLDDSFLFHEWIAPVHLGVPEGVVLAGYGIAAGIGGWRFRAQIRDSEFLILGAALTFMTGAVAVDLLPGFPFQGAVEDAGKLVGLFLILAYAARHVIRLWRRSAGGRARASADAG